jgi:hypothetical protein
MLGISLANYLCRVLEIDPDLCRRRRRRSLGC